MTVKSTPLVIDLKSEERSLKEDKNNEPQTTNSSHLVIVKVIDEATETV